MITSKYNWKNIEKEPDDGFFEVTKKKYNGISQQNPIQSWR